MRAEAPTSKRQRKWGLPLSQVAQYGQWDGYIEGNGVTVFEFLKDVLSKKKLEAFKEAVNKCHYVTQDKIKEYYKEIGVDVEKTKFVSLDVSNRYKELHPTLDRDMGADILEYILNNAPCDLKDDSEFANSSSCEWAYLVNLDENKLEIYKGFNTTPLTPEDRFYNDGYVDDGYYPIKKVLEIPFYIIIGLTKETFIDICNINIMGDEINEDED